jgi:hypothetical protein
MISTILRRGLLQRKVILPVYENTWHSYTIVAAFHICVTNEFKIQYVILTHLVLK